MPKRVAVKRVTISCSVLPDMKAWIVGLARRQRRDVSHVINMILEDYKARHEAKRD